MTGAQLRWGVLGAAHIARVAVVPAIRAAGGAVAAVASRDPARARAWAAEIPGALACPNYQSLLEADLDAVYLPLPNSLHLPWTLRALAAGRHVLCEKPLALSAAEGEEMERAANGAGLVLAEAVMYRYHPRWRVVRQLIEQGRIGDLRHLRGTFTFPLAPPPDIRWQSELGGGALYDVGSYLVNACRWLAGEPTRVLARAALAHGVDLDGSVLMEFQSGEGPVSAELAYSFAATEHQVLELIGTSGSLLIPRPFTAWRDELVPLRLEEGGGLEVAAPAADPYLEMVLAFTERVGGGRALAQDLADSVLGLRALDAVRRSLASGAWESP
ncbi:MAG TPA: Gfo/Idh/MocA family oxidoreductase [Candidatus Dormibacteraeota bacterium]